MSITGGVHARRKIATVEKWKASGLSQAEFCRREGLQQWQLSEWKRFVQVLDEQKRSSVASSNMVAPRDGSKDKVSSAPGGAQPSPFVPVRLKDEAVGGDKNGEAATGSSYVLEVLLKHGHVIRVAANCEPRLLNAVVSAIGGW